MSSLALTALVLSTVCHGVALLLWRVVYSAYLPFLGFPLIFGMLIAASLLLSLFMFLASDYLRYRLLQLSRFGLLVLITLFLDTNFLLVLPFHVALAFETSVYERFPTNLQINAVLLLTVGILITRRLIVDFSPALLQQGITFGLVACVVAIVGSLLLRYYQSMVEYGEEIARLDQAFAELSKASEGFLQIANTAEERSVRSERDRITRELHDSIGYTFTNLLMIIQACKALGSKYDPRLAQKLEDAFELTQQGMEETRSTLHVLRAKEVSGAQGLRAVHRLIETFRAAASVEIRVDYANVRASFTHQIDDAIYHFVQEGLTNSLRHGKATAIAVVFWQDDDMMQVLLRDNGVGAPSIEEGIGLRGMRERLGELGGTLVTRNTDTGFELIAQIPLRD